MGHLRGVIEAPAAAFCRSRLQIFSFSVLHAVAQVAVQVVL